jgi:prevent-host-death family protein
MERIGVRELRQQASRYLARVRNGETFEITENGKPVAQLIPAQPSSVAALYASGYIRPAEGKGGIQAFLAHKPRDFGFDVMVELDATREERL